jgi:hypothetical protein
MGFLKKEERVSDCNPKGEHEQQLCEEEQDNGKRYQQCSSSMESMGSIVVD